MPSSIQKQYFRRVIIIFMISLAIATIGVFLGTVVPSQYFLPIKIIEVIMLIIAFFLDEKGDFLLFLILIYLYIWLVYLSNSTSICVFNRYANDTNDTHSNNYHFYFYCELCHYYKERF